MKQFPAVKFALGNEKNMSFLKILTDLTTYLQKFEKKKVTKKKKKTDWVSLRLVQGKSSDIKLTFCDTLIIKKKTIHVTADL